MGADMMHIAWDRPRGVYVVTDPDHPEREHTFATLFRAEEFVIENTDDAESERREAETT